MTPTAHKDYSATSLPSKLGFREGSRILVVGPPTGFSIGRLPTGTEVAKIARGPLDVVVLFVTRRAELGRRFRERSTSSMNTS